MGLLTSTRCMSPPTGEQPQRDRRSFFRTMFRNGSTQTNISYRTTSCPLAQDRASLRRRLTVSCSSVDSWWWWWLQTGLGSTQSYWLYWLYCELEAKFSWSEKLPRPWIHLLAFWLPYASRETFIWIKLDIKRNFDFNFNYIQITVNKPTIGDLNV